MTASVVALIGVLAAGTLFAGTFRRVSRAQVRQSGAVQRVLQWIDPPAIHVQGAMLMGDTAIGVIAEIDPLPIPSISPENTQDGLLPLSTVQD